MKARTKDADTIKVRCTFPALVRLSFRKRKQGRIETITVLITTPGRWANSPESTDRAWDTGRFGPFTVAVALA